MAPRESVPSEISLNLMVSKNALINEFGLNLYTAFKHQIKSKKSGKKKKCNRKLGKPMMVD